MKLRLIKPGTSPPGEKLELATVEISIMDTVQSWVHEFQSTKADRARLDFEQISNLGKI